MTLNVDYKNLSLEELQEIIANIDYKKLSIEELQKIIANCELELKDKQSQIHKEAIARIKEIADSINVTVEIHQNDSETEKKSRKIIEPKYRHPDDHSKTWTGRGRVPIWMKELFDKGHDKEEFLIK
ncbi:H-NS histone family protein [Methylobacter psychrophilus]|uniref:H-NS histone family protein n=1 Tax=Methylobacter psychrophilus TaxID=96941 RepID=UPI0021D5094A|nr:H-NS histone family protein [Methylobacter psychrophilus]